MTPKERVKRALAHEQTDYCPYELGFDTGLRERLVELTGDDAFDRNLVHHMGSIGIGYPETHERVDDHHYTDAFAKGGDRDATTRIGLAAIHVENAVLYGCWEKKPLTPKFENVVRTLSARGNPQVRSDVELMLAALRSQTRTLGSIGPQMLRNLGVR